MTVGFGTVSKQRVSIFALYNLLLSVICDLVLRCVWQLHECIRLEYLPLLDYLNMVVWRNHVISIIPQLLSPNSFGEDIMFIFSYTCHVFCVHYQVVDPDLVS